MTRSSCNRTALRRPLLAGASVAAAAAGLLLASHHPLWPGLLSALFCVWFLVSYWRPGMWLAVLPATLPLLNFSPWTGWLVFDEFDLAVLSTVAAEFARLAWQREPLRRAPSGETLPCAGPYRATPIVLGLACVGLVNLSRGLGDAGAWSFGLFQGYADPLNSARIFKPVFHILLLLPLLKQAFGSTEHTRLALERLVNGMLFGLFVVTLAVLWDRAAHPGLLDFASPYRTVALFWEMHVGGAAIDAYLALAIPFVGWRLYSTRTPLQWGATAVLALLTEYVCLTTFSRGVYLAVITSLGLLGLLLRRQSFGRPPDEIGLNTWAARMILLAMLMVLEAVFVLGSSTFMMTRIGSSEHDFRDRFVHWQNGLALLRTPGDWAFGVGLGRLPSRYAATVSDGEFPGRVELHAEPGHHAMRIFGPRSRAAFGGLYGLTQRVPIQTSESLLVRFDAQALHATRLRLSVCEMHLLYERNCLAAEVTVQATGHDSQAFAVRLVGAPLTVGNWYAPRMGVFSMTVLDAGGAVELDNVSLKGSNRVEQLLNGDFMQQLAHWFPVAKNQFLPWHIDNLYIEIMIERGLAGLIVFLGLIGCAAWNLCLGSARRLAISPFLLASVAGVMTVGLVSSVMDVPRVALLVLLVVFVSMRLNDRTVAAR
jgi:O-Antigen ligase